MEETSCSRTRLPTPNCLSPTANIKANWACNWRMKRTQRSAGINLPLILCDLNSSLFPSSASIIVVKTSEPGTDQCVMAGTGSCEQNPPTQLSRWAEWRRWARWTHFWKKNKKSLSRVNLRTTEQQRRSCARVADNKELNQFSQPYRWRDKSSPEHEWMWFGPHTQALWPRND